MLPSEYRLCRDFQRGKKLSDKQIAALRKAGLMKPIPPASADMHTVTIDTPTLSNFALAEIERYRSGRLRFLLPICISAASLVLSLVALLK